MEEWRDVVSYERFYKVSNLGEVKSVGNTRHCVSKLGKVFLRPFKNKVLNKTLGKRGYYTVMLSKFETKPKRVPIHTIVAYSFIGDRPKGNDINHKDCNKLNNAVENLEYVTELQNVRHAIANKRVKNYGEGSHFSKIKEKDVFYIRTQYKSGNITQKRLADQYGISRSHVGRIVNHGCWRHV